MMLKKTIGAVATLSVLSLVSGGTAFAQGRTWAGTSLQQIVEMARWKIGPVRANAAFTLSNTGYDSDIYYGSLSEDVPDVTSAASVSLQVLIPIRRTIVFDLVESPQYVFYLDTKNERAWNNSFRGQVHVALEKLYFRGGGKSYNLRRRLSPELMINVREKTSGLDGLALWQVSKPTSVALMYAGERFDYRDPETAGIPIAEVLNRTENKFGAAFYLQPNPRVRFFLEGQYGTYDFPEVAEPTRDARSYRVTGGFEFIPKEGEVIEAARVRGNLSLGYVALDMRNPLFLDGSGLAGDIDLSLELLRKTIARAFFSRGFQFSVIYGASYYFVTVYGGGITRRLSRRVFVSYNLSLGRSEYPESAGGGGVPQGVRNRLTTHMGSLEIRLARELTMTLLGTFGSRMLAGSGEARNRNFFGINLVYGSPPARIAVPQTGMIL
jgi:hypothetical protein